MATLRKLILVADLALAAALVLILSGFMPTGADEGEAAPVAPVARTKAPRVVARRSPAEYNVISRLLAPPPAPVPAVEQARPAALEAARSSMKLHAIHLPQDPTKAMAVIDAGKGQRIFQPGDEIIAGSRLVAVADRSVTVKTGDREFTLEMDYEGVDGAPSLPAARTGRPHHAARPAGGRPRVVSPRRPDRKTPGVTVTPNRPLPGPTVGGRIHRKVPAADVDKMKNNLGGIIRDEVRSGPKLAEGSTQWEGWQLNWVKPNSTLTTYGFRSGDVVRRVNGRPITGMQAAMQLWTDLQDATHGEVEVERGGRMVTLVFDVE